MAYVPAIKSSSRTSSYNHDTGSLAAPKALSALAIQLSQPVKTPLEFSRLPDFNQDLIIRMGVLEWAGLYHFLPEVSTDLRSLDQDVMLLSGITCMNINIEMREALAFKASKSTLLLLWLSIWLLHLTQLVRDVGLQSLPCTLTTRSGEAQVTTMEVIGQLSVTISHPLCTRVMMFAHDTDDPFEVSIGSRDNLYCWQLREDGNWSTFFDWTMCDGNDIGASQTRTSTDIGSPLQGVDDLKIPAMN